jgi:hypothetical protein
MLAGVKLPPIYETAFAHADPSDGKVSLQALNRVLSLGGSHPYMIEKVSICNDGQDVVLDHILLCHAADSTLASFRSPA